MNTQHTTAKHTPGPIWFGAYKANGELAAILQSESEAYFYIRNRGHMHGGTYRQFGTANEIAAAPELLAIARSLAAWVDDPDACGSDLADIAESAKDAITKAEGQP